MKSILELLPEEEKAKLIEEVAALLKEKAEKEKAQETASKESIKSIINSIV